MDKKLFLRTNEGYTLATIRTTPFNKFFEYYIRMPIVHYLALDIEGSEYRIMNSTMAWMLNSTDICQISAEFHGPLHDMGLRDRNFAEIFIRFLEESPYVPVRAFNLVRHHRFSMLNVISENCRMAFFA